MPEKDFEALTRKQYVSCKHVSKGKVDVSKMNEIQQANAYWVARAYHIHMPSTLVTTQEIHKILLRPWALMSR